MVSGLRISTQLVTFLNGVVYLLTGAILGQDWTIVACTQIYLQT